MINLIYEDFHDFSSLEFPYDLNHSALGEYHTIKPKGYMGNFYDPVPNHQWRSQGGSFLFVKIDNKTYLEQSRGDFSKNAFKDISPILVCKTKIYAKFQLEFEITPLSLANYQGICFNYLHARKYDSLSFRRNDLILYRKNQSETKILAKYDYEFKALNTYHFKIEIDNNIKVYLNDLLVIDIPYILNEGRKVAFIAKCATRYSYLKVSMSDLEYKKHKDKEKEYEDKLSLKRKSYSPLELFKKIDLKNFGSGRQLRFAREDGKAIFLLAQHQKRILRDSYARISCLTAFDIDGNILWQKGSPNNSFDNTYISCDLPFQIADINNDGKLEVLYVFDFKLYVAKLKTGEVIDTMDMPNVADDPLFLDYPFEYLNADMIRVADFSGLGFKGDIIVKDRYRNLFAYNLKTKKLLFRYHHKNTGHFPFVYDFNNDKLDELLIGYDLVDSKGNILWSLPIESDHTDEILYLSLKEGEPKRFYLASGNEGFNIVDINGNIIKSVDLGHVQRISASRYDKTKDEMEIALTTFWGSDRTIYLLDKDGNILKEVEMEENGNVITPVAYDGENILIMSNATETGGLLDSNLDPVVKFPNDDHPVEVVEVIDIDCDGIDEIITFNKDKMYIYKAKNYKSHKKYLKYPNEAYSNYRGEYLTEKD